MVKRDILRRLPWAFLVATRLADAFVFTMKDQRTNFVLQETAFSSTTSSSKGSGVSVDNVVQGIYKLFPPEGLEQRIALSRKDGYWPYISKGEEPPKEFVYGEFDIYLLEQSLERARDLLQKNDEDIIFCDAGSGIGRLVLATAALYPNWKLCRGIELLPTIHEESLDKLEDCRRRMVDDEGILRTSNSTTGTEHPPIQQLYLPSDDGPLPLAPIEMECGSFEDPYSSFCDADILFCFSSCLSSHLRINLARSIGRQSRTGTIIITTEYQLPLGGQLAEVPDDPDYPCGEYELELLDTISGPCTAVGGESTVYIHRVLKSVGNGKRRVQPTLPVSELAYRAIQHMEQTDTSKFIVQVSNQMAFLGFPESWRPKI